MPKRPPSAAPRRTRTPRRIDPRPAAHKRGYDHRHRRWREAVLKRFPLCVVCERHGRITPATIAHHVVEVRDDPGKRLEVENGIGVCHSCHNSIHHAGPRGANE